MYCRFFYVNVWLFQKNFVPLCPNSVAMEKKRMKYPIGVQGFEKLRTDGYVYVDKTEYLYRMVNEGNCFFLSRPRRFGKSLFLSTLHNYFEGKKELFEGTYVGEHEAQWLKYPVLKLDLNAENYTDAEKLEGVINDFLSTQEELYGTRPSETSLGLRFQGVIRRACEITGRRVVILVDEYDKPLLQAIGRPDIQDAMRGVLKGFYGALKSMDEYIKFAFLTGVTKFGKVSVFSDLNNLRDISMSPQYSGICGISEEELIGTFHDSIDDLAAYNGMTYDECLATLRRNYDGYHFEENSCGMYNPFSVLNTFANNKFGSYWFETGTPTYLVNLLQRHEWNLRDMETSEVSPDILNSIDSENSNPIPVIYQSGYLTIKEYNKRFDEYVLGFPNKEVEEGFVKYLAPYYLSREKRKTVFDVRNFVKDVERGKAESFCQRLKALFSDTPYELVRDLENHYQNIVWVVFKMLGFYTQAEYHTSQGRIDLVIKAPGYTYVMEFKLDGTAEEALTQIKSKDYSLPFSKDDATVYLIGMNFSHETRNIERYVIEQM